ncbi:hypothetical protein [Ruficoccus sp. ZRK36]|uniref:hypothetical protein n=1 Tax=Ruficoccus sp. ZRK36 TaxID=2866311 RepID=UPI001C73A8DE|nr:hypothetical protein [Ruficoccus sp. ZRK36]QYY34453.1 hypothetical protein K0V07_09035 [Ruficoccus sp. ZRK36]
MTPESFTQTLQDTLGEELVSVILYGSAARGDHSGTRSDFNLMVTCKRLDMAVLDKLAKPAQSWVKAGNRAPLMFTEARLQQSRDAFPIELLDMQAHYKVLSGDDPLNGLVVETHHLRWQLEHELKGALIQLRERYLAAGGKPDLVTQTLVGSLATFTTLVRASLRCLGKEVPACNDEALGALAGAISFDPEPFRQVDAIKRKAAKPGDIPTLFAAYLASVEQMVDAIDSLEDK